MFVSLGCKEVKSFCLNSCFWVCGREVDLSIMESFMIFDVFQEIEYQVI